MKICCPSCKRWSVTTAPVRTGGVDDGSRWNRMNNSPGLNSAKRPTVNVIMIATICQEVTAYRGNQHIDFQGHHFEISAGDAWQVHIILP